MAKQSFSIPLAVELQDMDHAKRTIVRVKFKDVHGREWVKEPTVPAPPNQSAIDHAIGGVLKEMADRHIALADFSRFKSNYKADDLSDQAQEGKPKPPLRGIPGTVPDEGQKEPEKPKK